MAVNKSALDGLNSLATGGSPGLDAYRQAQQKEAASRTQALQGALGGNDVYDAAMKSTAQYAPKVEGTGFQNAGNLLPAANQYLSEAADRIASENYVSHLKDTAKNRDAQLLGASEVMANQQRDALAASLDPTGVQATLAKQQELRAQLTAHDEGLQANGSLWTPEMNAKRESILREMHANDVQFADVAGKYTAAMGTDSKGLMDQYNTGNAQAVNDLLTAINPQAQAVQDMKENAIRVGGQARLRELAPLFGMDPLEAEGKFQAGMGNDLARTGKVAGEADYVSGKTTTADQNEAEGGELGFEDPKAYGAFKNQTRMSGQDIHGIMNTGEWNDLKDLTTQYIAQGGRKDADGNVVATGVDGYRQSVQAAIENAKGPDGQPLELSDKDKAALINLATAYFNPTINRAFGKGEAE